jgi:endonuclease/exonuclease/phosphatase (EEP) superfamily protein YafD
MHTFKKIAYKTVLVAGILLSLLTAASLLYDTGLWFLQVLNFPRLAFLIALAFCLVFALVLKKWHSVGHKLFIATVLAAITIQAYIIFPYTFFAPNAVPEADRSFRDQPADVSIMVANVLMTNRETEEFFEIVHEASPDILITLEPDKWWIEQLAVLHSKYPYRVAYPASNTYGMALYSKLPLPDYKIYFLNQDSVPSIVATIQVRGGKTFRMMAVHPVAPVPSGHPTNIGSVDEESLKLAANMLAQDSLPTILAGDFNDVGWSHNLKEFEKRCKMKDTRRGRGMYNTFKANSWFFRWPLDYVYVSYQWKVTEVERLDDFGSDHFPFMVKLVLE